MKKKTCTKCGKQKPLKEFPFRTSTSYYRGKKYEYRGRNSICRSCINARQLVYSNERYATDENYRQSKLDAAKRRREERYEQAYEILGGECVDCGATDDLQFDHVKARGIPISTIINGRWDRVLEELEKCELRCADCHAKRHGPGWVDNRP